MKKFNLILLLAISSFNCIQAQDTIQTKFNIITYGGIGYGNVENDNEPNYNLNSNTGEVLLNYNFNQKFGIATGIGINELSGNGFNSIGNFYHERTVLKVPLLFTAGSKVSENFRLFVNFGVFGQHIIKDDYGFLTTSQKDVYDGWNFGAQVGAGFLFEMFNNFSAGINYNGQSDFSKFKSNTNSGIDDKQKMNNLSSIGMIFMIHF